MKKTGALLLMALFASGCVEHGTRTYYAAEDRTWAVGAEGISSYRHDWSSGAHLTVYLRKSHGDADLLFELEVPEGVPVSAPDLTARMQSAGGSYVAFHPSYIRQIDYVAKSNGDYEVIYTDLKDIDGVSGATLHRPTALGFRKLNRKFEWNIIAKAQGSSKIVLRLPSLVLGGIPFNAAPTEFGLVTGRVVVGSPVW